MKTDKMIQIVFSAVFVLTLCMMAVAALCYFCQWMSSETMKQILLWMTVIHFASALVTWKDDTEQAR